MRIRRFSFPRRDGRPIEAWRYEADAPRAAVFLCPALAARPAAYDALSRYLCRRGAHVLVPQYRLERDVSLRDWTDDITAAVHGFREQTDGLPMHAVGHSFGGLFLGLTAGNAHFEKLLLVASPRANVWTFGARAIPGAALSLYLKVPLLWRFRDDVSLQGIGLDGRVPARAAAESARLIRGARFDRALESLALRSAHFEGFHGDLVSLCFTDDPLATLGPARSLAALFKNAASREVRQLDPRAFDLPEVSHVGFFHRRCQEKLWPAVIDDFVFSPGIGGASAAAPGTAEGAFTDRRVSFSSV